MKMKFLVCYILLISLLHRQISALKCWHCHDQPTNEACMRNGYLEMCLHNQDACEAEIRVHDHVMTVNKRCKQALACGNNYMQNMQPAWFGEQCNPSAKNTVCRCCCSFDMCNHPEKECMREPVVERNPEEIRPPFCTELSRLENGRTICTPELNNGQALPETVCHFICDEGYKVDGFESSTCVGFSSGYEFDNPVPVCRASPMCKPFAPPANGKKICTPDNEGSAEVGTVCRFECNPGYILRGFRTRVCKKTSPIVAVFSRNTPICRPNPRCPPVGIPEDGSATCSRYVTGGVPPGATCTFLCNEGYKRRGSRQTRCQVGRNPTSANYNNPVPDCEPNPQCKKIETPINGFKGCSQEGDRVDVGTECSFRCKRGFKLVGALGSTCIAGRQPNNALWDNETPRCRPDPKCSALETPVNGSKECSQETELVDPGTICSFSCDVGYLLIGGRSSTCRIGSNPNRAAFDSLAPTCRPNPKCDRIFAPENGRIRCSDSRARVSPGTFCSFTCNPGYVRVGPARSTCGRGKNPVEAAFNNKPPTCWPNPKCDIPETPNNGTKDCTQTGRNVDPGTICKFDCDEGYMLLGAERSTCREGETPLDAAFDNFAPGCVPNPKCYIIETPEFGNKTCSQEGDRVDPGTICTFECDKDYKLVGSQFSICVEGTTPFESAFNNRAPKCNPDPMCNVPETPDNGRKTCSQAGARVKPGTTCTFACDPGYLVVGHATSTCIQIGRPTEARFNREAAQCQRNPKCPLIGTPQDGTKNCTQNTPLVDPGTSCIFSCNEGYLLVGARRSTCREAENPLYSAFDNRIPACTPNPMCPVIQTPEHGSKSCTQEGDVVEPGTVCTFNCDPGYILEGPRRSTCRAADNPLNSAFDNEAPTCASDPQCDIIGTPTNGRKFCTRRGPKVPPGTVCVFSCEPGYLLDGLSRSTCREDENPLDSAFDNPMPSCAANPLCASPSAPEHGSKNCTQEGFLVVPGTICTFSCDPGYLLEGSEKSTCQGAENPLDSAFVNKPPVCISDPKCALIATPENGKKSCTQDDSEVQPGTVCTFACDPGYLLIGRRRSTCRAAENPLNSAFDNLVPTCRPNPLCPIIDAPEQGSISCTRPGDLVLPGTVCSFRCNPGYIMDGSRTSTCRAAKNPIDSAFDNAIPTCLRDPKCELIATPDNGRKNCTQSTPQVTPGTRCTFGCNEGYLLIGSRRSTCREAENPLASAFDNRIPACTPNPMCPIIPAPQHGSKSCTQDDDFVEPGTVCTFSCELGYILEGSRRSTCRAAANPLNSAFNNDTPTCVPDPKCDVLLTPDNGRKFCTQNTQQVQPGTRCFFECDEGYFIEGESMSICIEGRTPIESAFDNEAPVCKPKPKCKTIEPPMFGFVFCSQEGDVVDPGTFCTFECQGGYILEGTGETVCIEGSNPNESRFDSPTPSCISNPKCDAIDAPVHGSKSCTQDGVTVDPGTVCTFSCEPGYLLQGHEQSECLSAPNPLDSKFDNPTPICSPNPMCDFIGVLSNGKTECGEEGDKVNPGTVCIFICDDGYLLFGEARSECRTGARPIEAVFDNSLPVCIPNPKCEIIKTPENGRKECTQNGTEVDPGTKCEFFCNEGYILEGARESTCVEGESPLDEAFDNQPPICRPEPKCDQVGTPANGRTVCTENGAQVSLNTECRFSCDEEYVLVGSSRSVCVASEDMRTARFNNDLPFCRRGECDELEPIANGRVRCSDKNNLNSVCNFRCRNGFILHPPNRTSTVCDPNTAFWTNPNPCCISSCPANEMDLVMILDSSGSIGAENWEILKSFVQGLINDLEVRFGATKMGLIMYSDVVDPKQQIQLTFNKDAVLRLVGSLQWMADETNTGLALRYARKRILGGRQDRKDIPNVVLVMTDGKSDDNAAFQANKLREDGAIVYTVGIEPSGFNYIDINELNAIAGSKERVVFVEEGYHKLNQQIAEEIKELICGKPSCPE
ncbi:sushi, von Willebrand factor type A, EGF and pentraxin domain-containing protein 1-like [Clavelina lepadiformis]|uniref:sushi, von Willebrand factor type A, EGF and pentraxin domain-containing protein 1-like n=1 Tax=Clavelina lepadiformis TaxID=159417 RepID=UPI00404170E2